MNKITKFKLNNISGAIANVILGTLLLPGVISVGINAQNEGFIDNAEVKMVHRDVENTYNNIIKANSGTEYEVQFEEEKQQALSILQTRAEDYQKLFSVDLQELNSSNDYHTSENFNFGL